MVAARLSVQQDGQGPGLGHVPRPQNFTIGNKLPSEGFLANSPRLFSFRTSRDHRVEAWPQQRKKSQQTLRLFSWLRDQDSNLGPRGYEPRELPLLHPAHLLDEDQQLYPEQLKY